MTGIVLAYTLALGSGELCKFISHVYPAESIVDVIAVDTNSLKLK